MVSTQKAYRADCCDALATSAAPFDLIIADPPYNQGMQYENCDDNKSADEYYHWTQSWLNTASHALKPHGSMWVFAPDEWVSEVDCWLRRQCKMHKRRHVIWTFTFGQKAQHNFTRSHCHLLYMTKSKNNYTFNEDAVKVPSARQLVYKDKRAQAGGKPPDATWMLLREQLEPYMTPDSDTWLHSRVCGSFHERHNHSPNQIPVPLMERIVLACSKAGDKVCDPFAGTGSSGVACKLHGRDWVGYDTSQVCVDKINERLAKVFLV